MTEEVGLITDASLSNGRSRISIAYDRTMTQLLRRPWLFVAGLIVLSVALRLTYMTFFVGWTRPPEFDGIGYTQLATSLLEGKGYINAWGEPTAFRPPVYPMLMAVVFAISERSLAAVRLLQVLMDGLTVLVVFLLGKQLFDHRVAALAALGVALHPLLIYETGLMLPETMSYLVQFGAILWLILMVGRSSPFYPFLVGVLTAVAILARPTAALWAPLILLWVLLAGLHSKPLQKSLALALGLALVIAPWVIRNWLILDAFVPVSSNSAVNLWCGNNPLAEGGSVQPAPTTWNGSDYPTRGLDGWDGLSEVESNGRFAAKGMEWIRENPSAFLGLVPKKLLRLWSPASFSVQFGREVPPPVLFVALLAYLIFLAAAAYGLYLNRFRWREIFPLLAVIISINILVIIYYGATRYAIPMMIALILFAAFAVDHVMSSWGAPYATHGCHD